MTISGTFAGVAITATVSTDDNYASPRGLTARLDGTFAGQAAILQFSYDLKPSYAFGRGEVTGEVAGSVLRADVQPESGSAAGTVSVSGTSANDEFTLTGHRAATFYL
jgi:hypothetical protein